jgi:hypothetical protein
MNAAILKFQNEMHIQYGVETHETFVCTTPIMKTWINKQRSGMHKSKDYDGIHVLEEVHTMNKLHENRLSAFDEIYKASYSTAKSQRLYPKGHTFRNV